MNKNEEKLVELISGKGFVSLNEILGNLKVLQVEGDSVSVSYFVTRSNKDMPWPAPYQAGSEIDGKPYYCCSYSTLEDDEWPEDTKKLTVYHVFVDD
jgi:hypothetical protein